MQYDKIIRAAGNRRLLSVARQWLLRQESNNLIGSASWTRQWVKIATEQQPPNRCDGILGHAADCGKDDGFFRGWLPRIQRFWG